MRLRSTALAFTLVPFLAAAVQARPDLPPGKWVEISPAAAQIDEKNHVFCQGMAVDPSNPSTLYLCVCGYEMSKPVGVWKTTDGGTTWKRVGHLDEPIHIAVDPKDPNHLYAVDGVRGNSMGFWVSKNGGETWTQPEGFVKASGGSVGSRDLYSLSTEPGNFDHVLVSFHGPWTGTDNAGVLESTDGGASWTARNPPPGSAKGYGMSIFFLKWPEHNLGDAKTWLFTAQQGGFFRTTDGGASWSLAHTNPMTHGGNQIYCSKAGHLYSGGYQYPSRSTDNGKTWTQVKTGLDYQWYMGVAGDGNNIYLANGGENRPYFMSPETDGVNWSAYDGGKQTFSSQPFEMHFDKVNGILYSATWDGLLAMKVPGANGIIAPPMARPSTLRGPLVFMRNGVRVEIPTGETFSVQGRKTALAPE